MLECTKNKVRKLFLFVVVNPHPGYFFPLIFRKNGRRRGRQTHTERNTGERDTPIGCLPMRTNWGWGLNLQPRYVPLMGNRTLGPLVCRLTLSRKIFYFYFLFVGRKFYFLKNETISFLGSLLMHHTYM